MTRKKIAIMVTSIVTVAAMAVAGATMAWFSDSKEVSNTFTVGNVNITMDEAKVEKEGNKFVAKDARVTENSYDAIYPGAVIPKDPTITVNKNSEDCYVGAVVTINNWLSIPTALQAKVSAMIPSDGWEIIDGNIDTANNTFVVKYKYTAKVTKSAQDQKLAPVFTGFTVPDTLTQDDLKALDGIGFKIDVKGAAIQAEGFDTVEAAMAELLK